VADTPNFTKLVPGFDFLQGLVKNAGAALPSIGQWVAPTLNPEELEKRIEELRTVQFWLEQNARMLGATIQALEVQRMTLSTLKTMNVQMEDLRESLRIKLPEVPAPAPAPEPLARSNPFAPRASAVPPKTHELAADEASPPPAPAAAPKSARSRTGKGKGAGAPATAEGGAVDPMQWWGALTKQFTQLATSAMKDTATDAARDLATTMVRNSFDTAGETLKKAADLPAATVRKVTDAPPPAPRRKSATSRPRRA
jgi:hypothetical protein